MTRMRWWWLACALATGMGCSTGEPASDDAGTNPFEDLPAVTDTGSPKDNGPLDTGPRCTSPQIECDGTCVDPTSNPNHCGACGMACTAGQSCMNGACTAMMRTCMDGQTDCGGTCVDTTRDTSNCGSCGNACASGQMCVGGACMTPAMCMSGQTDCGGTCVDTNADAMNCGRCGNACPAGQACMAGSCMATTMCMSGQTACAGTCVDTNTDIANCGACGMACGAGESCTGGRCQMAGCTGGRTSCGGTCVDTNTDVANCGACGRTCAMGQTCAMGACTGMTACTAPLTRCGDACTDTNTDVSNCGRCGNACAMGQTCNAGSCMTAMTGCMTGQTMCGSACVDTATSNMHCGGCGNQCPSGQTCQMGACACSTMGQTLCGRTCVDTQTSATNCGMCGRACATGERCVAGACQPTCASGTSLCSGRCVNLQTDEANCGTCGTACAMGQTCNAGRCGCGTGETSCTTGMTTACVNLQTNNSNCGMCGRACTGGQTCRSGSCSCPTGTVTCSGRCVNTQTDSNNCGMCGRACPTGQSCSAGVCRPATAPSNDQRSGATTISLTSPSTTLSPNTANARHDTDGDCGCTQGSAQDVFYRFTLTAPEFVYADTFGTTWDTSLFLQDSMGRNVAASGTGQVTCNDDVSTAGFCTVSGSLQSQIAARLNPGTYFLVVSGCGNGAATVHFQHLPAGNGAAVRHNPGATAANLSGSTSGTGTSTAPNCTCSGGPENSYFWVTCPDATAVPFFASTCGGGTTDTVLDQRSAARSTSVSACNDDTNSVCALQSTLTSTIPAGAGLHTLLVDGCNASGAYRVTVAAGTCPSGQTRCATCVDTQNDNNNCGGCNRVCGSGTFCRAGACVTPPANDTVAGATVIDLSRPSQLLSANTTNARHHVNGSCSCTNGTTNNDVFFRFTLTNPEVVYADTIGATWDTALSILTSTGGTISAAGITNGTTCNDDGGLAGCATGLQSQVFARLNPGTYLLQVTGCGSGAASVRFQHLPQGTDDPTFLVAGTNRSSGLGITIGTGRVTGTSCPSTSPEDGYFWYTCQNFAGGTFTASTCGRASWDTILAQHSAGRAQERVCADDNCGGTSRQSTVTSTIPAGPGLHAVYVDGFNGASGIYSFQYTRP